MVAVVAAVAGLVSAQGWYPAPQQQAYPPPPPPPSGPWQPQPSPQPAWGYPPSPDYGYQYPAPEPPGRTSHHGRHGKWRIVATLSAGGSAKEVSLSGFSECMLEVTGGQVGFRTVVVRRGGAKQSITVNRSLPSGQSVSIPIDRSATGLRISDTGRGTYRVLAR